MVLIEVDALLDGIITSDRFAEGHMIADEIVPMRSAAVPEAQRRQRGYHPATVQLAVQVL